MSFTIYLLGDPQDPTTAYVGQTRRAMKRRMENHKKSATHNHSRCARWLRTIFSRGKEPTVTVLEMAESAEQANDCERKWIAKLRNQTGITLMNTAAGGQAPFDAVAFGEIMRHVLSRPDLRERLRERTSAAWHDPVIRARRIAGQREEAAKPEAKARKSRTSITAAKAFWADDAKRAVRVAGLKRSWTDERKAAARALWADPDHRAKRLAAQKAAFADPTVRARISDGLKERYRDPNARAKTGRASRETWKDPEIRANRLAAQKAAFAKRRESIA